MKRSRLAIFTICSNNYMPSARVFFDSVRRHHPEADLFLGLADVRLDTSEPYGDVTVIPANELSIPAFQNFAFRYDIMEFNTAIKPFMFRHLIDRLGYDAVLYFDPDIEVFRPLEEVVARLVAGASFVLTPHLCAPNEAKQEPNDLTIMRAGIYNLGFLGVSRCTASTSILDWWARRLEFLCINAQEQGIFVDQKFMDLVPGFSASAFVSHDTSMNVAYWNIGQRVVGETESGWTVDGKPLTFFHYSGFDPRHPKRLSKHQEAPAPAMGPSLKRLVAGYAQRLLAQGYGVHASPPYAYGRFASGTLIHPLVRAMFRESEKEWVGNPFETYETFLHSRWPASPGSGPMVTRFMKFLHERFPNLSVQLDPANAAHMRELTEWYAHSAPQELDLHPDMIRPVAASLYAPPHEAGGTRTGLHREPRHASIGTARAELDRIYASTSWRVTRPLRALAHPRRTLHRLLRMLERYR